MNNLKNLMKLAMVALALTITMGACNQQQESNKKETKVEPAKAGKHLDIKYIDEDKALQNYDLTKGYDVMTTRKQNEYDQQQKTQANQQ